MLGGAPVREASRGPFVFASRRCLDFSSSVSRLFAFGLRAPESRDEFRIVGGAVQRAAWQRSTLDPHRDLAPSKVSGSCPVASFDLLRSEVAAFPTTRRGCCVLPKSFGRCSTRSIDSPKNIPIDALVEEVGRPYRGAAAAHPVTAGTKRTCKQRCECPL